MNWDASLRDRFVIATGIAAVTALGWAYLFWDASANHCLRMGNTWTAREFTFMFIMWSIMMIAMMVPSATPMLLTFARLNRSRQERSAPYIPTAVLLSGYLLVWTAFSLFATVLQYVLQQWGVVSTELTSNSPWLSAALLIGAGLFQWMPVKHRCLTHCHTPWSLFTTRWREGHGGALRMGIEHGAFCVGCCWAIMLLLFVAGVMNLIWVAVLSIFVLAEKLAPRVARWAGSVFMVVSGAAVLVTS